MRRSTRMTAIERLCRLCGDPFVPEDPDQLHCSELCESTDRKIDEAEARREEKG